MARARPRPNILDGLVVVNGSFRRQFSPASSKRFRILPFACAQQPDWAASEPKILRSLQRPPKRTQREGGVAPHQVMR